MTMTSKPGKPRQSCDFCHRRKLKCDRLSRASEGLNSCSQCTLRQGPCQLIESGIKRTPKRRRGISGDHMESGESPAIRERTSINDNPAPVATPTAQLESFEPHHRHADPESFQYIDTMFSQHFLDLSRDNILFLDQVFLDRGEESIEWPDHERTPLQGNCVSTIGPTQTDMSEEGAQYQGRIFQIPALGGDMADPDTTFTAALHAYFEFAAPWLPILLEDAFWEDYRNGRCSKILLSAIACRGMPFTTLADKWDIQQRYANDFREAFLTARSTAPDDGTIRLDDLEALALMVNFEYDNTNSLAIHSSLGNLFLKHESLVLMTLQSRIENLIPTPAGPSVSLTRARDRRVLLYWHVYGLDAFHCLDRKQISLIPDREIRDKAELPQHEARDFFDAVFELALIARQLLQKLCSSSAKFHGIDPKDVHELYAQIYQWRTRTCPPHLRWQEKSPGVIGTQDSYDTSAGELSSHGQPSDERRKYTQLRRAVIWALEINCIMQIESFVSDFGLKDGADLHAEAVVVRVEFESLYAVNAMTSICRWVDQHPIHSEDGKQHSLVDLAPLALRNVCAGVCFWSSLHGIESTRGARERRNRSISAHIETATLLRNTAAKAISHSDTIDVLERIDKQLSLLKAAPDAVTAAT